MSIDGPSVLVLIADGTEEMEFTIVVDVLRRAGVRVTVAGLHGAESCTCSRGVRILPDMSLATARAAGAAWDVVVLPGGGPGAQAFAASAAVGELLAEQWQGGRSVAAICAAPIALAAHGVAAGRAMTAHPSVRDTVAAHGSWRDEPVVADGQLLTSRGPGTAFDFSFALVERLCGAETAAAVRAPMEFPVGAP